MVINNQCPCNKDNGDCARRKVNCHSGCPEYKVWRDEMDRLNEMKKGNSEYIEYQKNAILKRIKKRNEKRNFRR